MHRLGITVARLKLKGIDGGPHKRWSMWFNSTTRKTLPGLDIPIVPFGNIWVSSAGSDTGAAWLSSARVVRCWVKSRNEPTPTVSCHHLVGHSNGTVGVRPEEGGDDVKSSWPLCPGLHTYYNGQYKGQRTRKGKRIPKSWSQFGLESATRLHEVGIASNRESACRGEYVLGPCTHRPSHHESQLN